MFAQMMIPHHEQAVDMSEILLAKDDVPADVLEALVVKPMTDVAEIVALAPLPLMTAILFGYLFWQLAHLPDRNDRFSLLPFIAMTAIMVLGFFGLAYSFYPYVVPDRTTIYEAAAAPESLMIVLVGAMVVIPVIAIYSIYAYRVFGGKATDLRYD